jgi:hypothetical protein
MMEFEVHALEAQQEGAAGSNGAGGTAQQGDGVPF